MDEKGDTLISVASPIAANDTEDRDHGQSTYLIVLSGGIPGAMLPLGRGENWVGRSLDNSLQIPDASVSRHHALLYIDAEGLAWLSDQCSTNGTFVNGERLEEEQPRLLQDGDRIRMGPHHLLKFTRPAPSEERYHRELFERSVRDSLTGLYNRAYFHDQMGHVLHRINESGLGLAVLMLDLDHFKQINDTFGHGAGDTVLREVAAVLRQATRTEDLVARYGGEEFILAVPSPTRERAVQRAEAIRKMIAERRMRLEDGSIQVTASIGVAFAEPKRAKAPRALISQADLHLYRAKESGRNRTVWTIPAPEPDPDGLLTTDGESPGTRELPLNTTEDWSTARG